MWHQWINTSITVHVKKKHSYADVKKIIKTIYISLPINRGLNGSADGSEIFDLTKISLTKVKRIGSNPINSVSTLDALKQRFTNDELTFEELSKMGFKYRTIDKRQVIM